jgi:hypothetical protein
VESPVLAPPGPVTHRRQGIVQPKICDDGTVAWSSVLATCAASKDTTELHEYREALHIPHWRDAMKKEFFCSSG